MTLLVPGRVAVASTTLPEVGHCDGLLVDACTSSLVKIP